MSSWEMHAAFFSNHLACLLPFLSSQNNFCWKRCGWQKFQTYSLKWWGSMVVYLENITQKNNSRMALEFSRAIPNLSYKFLWFPKIPQGSPTSPSTKSNSSPHKHKSWGFGYPVNLNSALCHKVGRETSFMWSYGAPINLPFFFTPSETPCIFGHL